MASAAGPVITARWISTAVLPVAKVGLCLPGYWANLVRIIVVSTANKAGIAPKKYPLKYCNSCQIILSKAYSPKFISLVIL